MVSSAPAEKIAPPMNRTEAPDSKTKVDNKMGQAEPKAPADVTAPKRAEGDVKKDDSKPKAMENKGAENKPDMKTNDKAASEINTDKSKATSDVKAGVTIGQAAAPVKQLTVEQRATIHTVVKEQKVQPTTNVTFAITVGALVPRTVTFHPVPTEFVSVNSAWRGFEYFLVGDRIAGEHQHGAIPARRGRPPDLASHHAGVPAQASGESAKANSSSVNGSRS